MRRATSPRGHLKEAAGDRGRPCGLFASLSWRIGIQAHHPGARRGRAPTHKITGPVAAFVLNPNPHVQFGERAAPPPSAELQALQPIKDPRHLGLKVVTEFVRARRA